jgi:hypothetical protein
MDQADARICLVEDCDRVTRGTVLCLRHHRALPKRVGYRICTQCLTEFPTSEFVGSGGRCRDCRRQTNRFYYERHREDIIAKAAAWNAANRPTRRRKMKNEWRQASRDKFLQRAYGIDQEGYDRMLLEQGGLCAICRGDNRGRILHIDHCHETGRVRGLLCNHCNVGIGMLGDSPERCDEAAAYLRR